MMNKSVSTKKPRRNATLIDIVIIGISAVVVFVLASVFNILEAIFEWTRKHEALNADELVVVSVFLVFALLLFSLRRWLELRREITERKQVEEKLRIFSNAIAGAMDGKAITDMKGIITYTNPAMERIYGYEKGEMLGKSIISLSSDVEMANEIMSSMIKIGSWDGEIKEIKKNKETFTALLSLSTIKDDRGSPVAMIGGHAYHSR